MNFIVLRSDAACFFFFFIVLGGGEREGALGAACDAAFFHRGRSRTLRLLLSNFHVRVEWIVLCR